MIRINTNIVALLILAAAAAFALTTITSAPQAGASSPFDITFPIPELGNCANKTDCKAYCDIDGAETIKKSLSKTEVNQKQGNWNFRVRVFPERNRYQLVIQNNNGIGPFSVNLGDGTLYTAGNPPTCRGFQVFSTDQGRLPEHLPFRGTVTDCVTREKISFQIPAAGGGLTDAQKEERQRQCDAFAVKHNLGNAKERTEKLAAVEQDGGPGDCARNSENPNDSCAIFCSQPKNMKTCIEWVKQKKGEGVTIMSDKELAEADQVIAALDKGAKLPSFCSDGIRSCKDGCENPEKADQARECFRFAKEAGFATPDVTEAEMERMFTIMKSKGLSFRDMEKCEDNPTPACIDIATEAGLVKPEEAKLIKVTGGKGPGGCKGKNECENFCKNQANQGVCANFMAGIIEKNPDLKIEEFLSPEDRARMQEGIGRMRDGLAQATPEVKTCIEQSLPGIIAKIESDNLSLKDIITLGPKIGTVMEGCFVGAGGGGPGGLGAGISPEFLKCIREKGIDPASINRENPPPAVIECFQKHGGPGGPSGPGGFPGPGGPGVDGSAQGINVKIDEGTQGIRWIIQVPGGIQEFSANPASGSLYSGGLSGCPKRDTRDVPLNPPLKLAIKTCDNNTFEFDVKAPGVFSKGAPGGVPGRGGPGFPGGSGFPDGTGSAPTFPPEIQKCLEEKYGIERITAPTPDVEEKVSKCIEEAARGGKQAPAPGGHPEEPRPPGPGGPAGTPPEVFKQLEALRSQFPGGIPEGVLRQFEAGGVPKEILDKFRAPGGVPPPGPQPPPGPAPPPEPPPPELERFKLECTVRGGEWTGKDCKFPTQPPPGPPGQPPPPVGGPPPPPPPPDPAKECGAKGGSWDGQQCVFQQPPPPPPDPKTECEKNGGKWDANKKSCLLSQFTPPSLLNFFAQLIFGTGLE